MCLFFSALRSQQTRVLILDTATGATLVPMIKSWMKAMPNASITLNKFRLSAEESKQLTQSYSNIEQVSFDPLDQSRLVEQVNRARGYSIITTRLNVPFKKALLEELSSSEKDQPLQILGQAGSTVSHIELNAATGRNIAVTYTPGANANAVAEYVVAQIFNLMRPLTFYNELTHKGTWGKYAIQPPTDDVYGKTIGLIGYGHIAQSVAKKTLALGMSVIAYKHTKHIDNPIPSVTLVSDLSALLCNSNIISLHTPLTPLTTRLIGKKEIDMMPLRSYIINTSRGGIIDEEAVANELKKEDSRLAGVAFDVFENEGENFHSPLTECKTALLSPHIAGSTTAALTNTAIQLVININNILLNSAPVLANPELLKTSRVLYNC